MNKVLLLAGAACFISASASAFDFNPYIAARAKYNIARNEVKFTGLVDDKVKIHDNTFGGSIAAGTVHPVTTGDFRFEVEYTKNQDAKKNGTKVKTQAALFNVYFDLNLDTTIPVKPYASIGLGWGQAKFGNQSKKDAAAAQIGVGASYMLCKNSAIDLGYRYITYGDYDKTIKFGHSSVKEEYKPHSHELMLGFRYHF
ncbi:MAG: porin family protein [Alphaproteobacteria bacterium]|nr:porin family protein [Alphaproteobacteria bacterium]